MGDDKRELISAEKSVQYGLQPFAFEVEPGPDVFDDFRLRELFMHVDDLPGEVLFLLGRADAAVADRDVPGRAFPCEGIDVVQTVSSCVSDVLNGSIIGVFAECVRVQTESGCGFS